MAVSVELLDVRYARAVDRYVAAHPQGTPFHETRWTDLLAATFGFTTLTLVAADASSIRGMLPLALVAAPITGRRIVSVPFGVYGGVLASDAEAVYALDEAGQLLARRDAVRFLELRYLGRGPTRHAASATHATYRAALPARREDVLESIPRKARAEVRKARERHGLRLVSGLELLDGFYALYCLNKRGLGSPVFRKGYFRRILELFGHRALLHGVAGEQGLLTAVLSLADGTTLYPYYSGAAPEANRLGASNLLYASLMEEATARGFKTFDFGRSRVGSGPAAFKQHMGFAATPLDYQFYFPFGGRPPALHPDNPRLRLPQRVLSSLPLWMARAVGPTLMRHVP